ncbi:MAG: hypothetical protein B6D44_16090 [Ignavibacteriales bacterium UTCHB2]|nr:MAG: hypothetical protein B6D44_16090 [Ignavibacteriales bacterium UTCHB2]
MKDKTKRIPYTVLLPNDHYVHIDESIKYDIRLVAENENSIIKKFVDEIFPELNIKAPKIKAEFKKIALNNTLCNVLVANKKNKLLAISRRPDTYSNVSSYGLEYYTYRYIVGVVDALLEKQYAKQWKGYYDKNKKEGKLTRMWATQILLDEINKFHKPTIITELDNDEPCEINYIYDSKLTRRRFNNPIILKDKEKNIIKYKMNNAVFRMQNFLKSYNSFIDENSILIPESIILSQSSPILNSSYQTTTNPNTDYITNSTLPLLVNSETKCNNYIELDCWLYRVFNNSRFDQGGRFYGAEYQSLNADERSKILINNNKTREADYSAYHLRMLYHLEGIDFQGDPYLAVTEVKELRTPVKKMVQMIINAKNEYEAIQAFEKYLNEEPEIKNIVYGAGLNGRELARIITNTHKRIEKYFNTGIGVKLQFIDSKIAERILKQFTKKKVVCLCVHDSFIVEEQYLDELIEIMKREYKREIGFECELKVNGE